MKKKVVFALSIFAVMLFIMLIIPNKAMAVQSITSVEVTNKIPKYNDSLPHNSATVTAKITVDGVDYTDTCTVIVAAAG